MESLKQEQLRGMDEVKIRRVDLLAKVKENKIKHKESFDKAFEVYKKAAVAVLQEGIAEIDKQTAEFREGKRKQIGNINLWLKPPECHLGTYDWAVAMLEMSVDEYILLPQEQFAKFVMDMWGWSADFIKITSAYMGAQGPQGSQGFQGAVGRESLNELRRSLS